MLTRIAVRTKIVFVVSILIVVMIGSGLWSARMMRSINAKVSDIQTNWLPSVRTLGELRASTINYRNVIREHILSETAELKLAAEKTLQKPTDQGNAARAKYEKLITSPEERALFEQWSKLWDEYVFGTGKVMQLSREEAGKIPLGAHDLNRKVVNPISLQADEYLMKAIDLKNKGADAAGAEASESYESGFKMLVLVIVSAAIGGISVAILLVRDVSKGIASIIRPMQALSDGDLTAEVLHRGERTEIGQMADALQVFKEALIAKRAADELATAEAQAKAARSSRVDAVTRTFEASVSEIVETVSSASTELEASATTMTNAADHSLEIATGVASGSEQASSNLQSVASAAEEMGSSVNEIGRQVQESARIAAEAVDQAGKTNDRVAELARAAARIGDVVELINSIAGQTNLLALNATIEAARAGEAGRGFAVVATEVKALAEQTAKATGEISQQICGIQTATQEAVGAIRDIGDTIGRMSEISATIASAVEEQSAATHEISRNVQDAALGAAQVTSNILEVQRGASETGSASGRVLDAAQLLSAESFRLKREVESFLASVRAA
ncbi:methyl-accepting chemotaxis protein [Bradyrhizobium sp. 1]|uniref:methyl-accepting chemotaxis protein n=1 Tax=Bradyrhizobium sp. 1 TaxID=241591 RepID=UPI001FFC1CA2|nr:methyl-accepting chemotaxis protein [Bradyrhizobium sp. 1]MCK1395712.1 MCP four helix bundle domain-containing protein [Bradyrhizobium sp. 1]